jgi:hypothetical protein
MDKLNREKELETILTICVGFIVVFLITKTKVFLTLALVLGLVGLLSKFLTSKIAWLWMKLSEVMGAISSKVLLSVVFFFFLTPIAFLSRIFGKSNLQLTKSETTYYTERNHKYVPEDFENTF